MASFLTMVVVAFAMECAGLFDRAAFLWPLWYWSFPIGSLVGAAVLVAVCRRADIALSIIFFVLQAGLTRGLFVVLDLMNNGYMDPQMQPILVIQIPSTILGAVIMSVIIGLGGRSANGR